jgi:hypothetical protein
VNSLRQLLVSRDFKQQIHHSHSAKVCFEPVNDIFNVMKAAIGSKHQVVIKIIKQLDDKMVRDINEQREVSDMPISCLMDPSHQAEEEEE